jgi:hypothetical protein
MSFLWWSLVQDPTLHCHIFSSICLSVYLLSIYPSIHHLSITYLSFIYLPIHCAKITIIKSINISITSQTAQNCDLISPHNWNFYSLLFIESLYRIKKTDLLSFLQGTRFSIVYVQRVDPRLWSVHSVLVFRSLPPGCEWIWRYDKKSLREFLAPTLW